MRGATRQLDIPKGGQIKEMNELMSRIDKWMVRDMNECSGSWING